MMHSLDHPDQKKAEYVLFTTVDGTVVPTILSAFDFANFRTGKKEMPEASCLCMVPEGSCDEWMSLDGDLDVETIKPELLKKTRRQVAFLNGDISFLSSPEENVRLKEAHIHFLQKRIRYWNYDFGSVFGEKTTALWEADYYDRSKTKIIGYRKGVTEIASVSKVPEKVTKYQQILQMLLEKL
jgi:hypothetical protein